MTDIYSGAFEASFQMASQWYCHLSAYCFHCVVCKAAGTCHLLRTNIKIFRYWITLSLWCFGSLKGGLTMTQVPQ